MLMSLALFLFHSMTYTNDMKLKSELFSLYVYSYPSYMSRQIAS